MTLSNPVFWVLTIHCFREFEQLFSLLLDADMSKITRMSGCRKPCSYKEYNFVNTNLKDLSYYTFPEDQIAFCLWAVSQNTHIEEEVLVYSFESLVAELGGSLGLFLGFSFLGAVAMMQTSVRAILAMVKTNKHEIGPLPN